MTLDLKTLRWDIEVCPRCSNCKWVDFIYMNSVQFSKICPSSSYYYFDAYAAHGRMELAAALMDDRLEITPKLLEEIFTCTMCGACDVRCKRNLDLEVLIILQRLREEVVKKGFGPMPEHKKIAESIEESKNRYGASQDKRTGWMKDGAQAVAKADVVYFVGCSSSYKYPELAQATTKILKAASVDFMVLGGDEWCCGNPMYVTGQGDKAKAVAEHNIQAIKDSGASTVITSCAECYKTLKVSYPELMGKSTDDIGYRVMHVTEYIEPLIKEGKLKLKKPVNIKLSYHDACALGRLSEPWEHWDGKRDEKFALYDPPIKHRRGTNGVYEAPREILQAIDGVELVEMERARDQAWCCGAGGGVREAFKDLALFGGEERIEEAKSVGAEAIVSACPYCRENLREVTSDDEERIEVFDIVEIIAKVI
ncbi:MAG: (Fe-S)-binding protein [Chloroflexota bacterium]|nr:(Fe-S)-binding protein [Chloroflexota bacterium]